MKYREFSEQIGTVGTTTAPMTPTGQALTASLSGNVAALQDPKMQAANLAQQKKQKDDQKKAIQDQIAALQKQLADLNRTP